MYILFLKTLLLSHSENYSRLWGNRSSSFPHASAFMSSQLPHLLHSDLSSFLSLKYAGAASSLMPLHMKAPLAWMYGMYILQHPT